MILLFHTIWSSKENIYTFISKFSFKFGYNKIGPTGKVPTIVIVPFG